MKCVLLYERSHLVILCKKASWVEAILGIEEKVIHSANDVAALDVAGIDWSKGCARSILENLGHENASA